MSFKEKLEYSMDLLYLNSEQKKGLIEIILIVGSILIALKTPDTLQGEVISLNDSRMTVLFLLVLLLSILYFILIQKELEKNMKMFVSSVGLFISIIFKFFLYKN